MKPDLLVDFIYQTKLWNFFSQSNKCAISFENIELNFHQYCEDWNMKIGCMLIDTKDTHIGLYRFCLSTLDSIASVTDEVVSFAISDEQTDLTTVKTHLTSSILRFGHQIYICCSWTL